MKKILMLILMVAVLLVGCSANEEESKSKEIKTGKRIITDTCGRKVEIPEKINTVAVTGSAARLLTYAGCTDKIIALGDSDKQSEVGMPYGIVNAEKFKNLPVIAAYDEGVNANEEFIKLKPDVIFACAYGDTSFVDKLQDKTKIPVIGLNYDGIFADEVYNSLNVVGQVMGTQEQCDKVVTAMKGWQKDLKDRTKDIPEKDKPLAYSGAVSYCGPHGIEGTYGEYPPFIATNILNVVDETGKKGPATMDLEQVVKWNPDYIFLNPGSMNLVNDAYSKNKTLYDNLKAVKNGNVYSQVSYNWNDTNIELAIVDAYYAGLIIYPDKFKDVDFSKKADEIFTVMLGQPYLQKLEDAKIGFGKLTIGK